VTRAQLASAELVRIRELGTLMLAPAPHAPTREMHHAYLLDHVRPWFSASERAAERVELAYRRVERVGPMAAPRWLVEMHARIGDMWSEQCSKYVDAHLQFFPPEQGRFLWSAACRAPLKCEQRAARAYEACVAVARQHRLKPPERCEAKLLRDYAELFPGLRSSSAGGRSPSAPLLLR
jgi:hypothetical protein